MFKLSFHYCTKGPYTNMYSFILTIKLIPKSNRKIIERDKMYSPNTQIHDATPNTQIHDATPNTQIHDHSLFWVGTDALFFFRIAGVKLVLWVQTSTLGGIMLSFKCCPHMSEMSTFTYNLANSIIRKNAIIMSIIHNMLDLHDNHISSSKENRWPQPLFKY
jgi:hypothetical protein